MDRVPQTTYTTGGVVATSGVFSVANLHVLTNVVLLSLIVAQLAYLVWRWRRDYKKYNHYKEIKEQKALEASGEQ